MGVGEEDAVDFALIKAERHSIVVAKALASLEKPAIDQNATARRLDQMAGPGDILRGPVKRDLHASVPSISHKGLTFLLLNVGPRGDGSIPDAARDTLLAVGGWLKVNGEAIYGARPWTRFGEGPTENEDGSFSESKAKPYTPGDFRFTTRNGRLYAIQLAEPENGKAIITSVRSAKSVTLLSQGAPLAFSQAADGLTITLPSNAPRSPANVYRIEI
jgi:alpha-L-fucosidase